jgi:hypothetical protein
MGNKPESIENFMTRQGQIYSKEILHPEQTRMEKIEQLPPIDKEITRLTAEIQSMRKQLEEVQDKKTRLEHEVQELNYNQKILDIVKSEIASRYPEVFEYAQNDLRSFIEVRLCSNWQNAVRAVQRLAGFFDNRVNCPEEQKRSVSDSKIKEAEANKTNVSFETMFGTFFVFPKEKRIVLQNLETDTETTSTYSYSCPNKIWVFDCLIKRQEIKNGNKKTAEVWRTKRGQAESSLISQEKYVDDVLISKTISSRKGKLITTLYDEDGKMIIQSNDTRHFDFS